MSERRIRKYILQLCFCIVACAIAALSFAEDATEQALYAALAGRWEGTLAGAFRSQDVSWHFEVDEAGALKGYMGPSVAGMPKVPMENLSVNANEVNFDIAKQHATFTGTISAGGIAGTWRQGTPLPLQMKKKHFVFELPDSTRAALLGGWEVQGSETEGGYGIAISFSGISVQRIPGAAIHLEFTETEDGKLSGTMSIPASGLNAVPLVDIYLTEEGFAQFATDNGRSFSGKLINGVLVGDFASPDRPTRSRSFARAGRSEQGFDLDLSDAAWQRLAGRWYYEVIGDDVVLEVFETEEGKRRGQLIFDEGPLGRDPLLELVVEGDSVRLTTLTGRTFSGSFSEEAGGEDIVGEYRVNAYPFRVTFTRKP